MPPESQQRQEYRNHPGDDHQGTGDGGFPGFNGLVGVSAVILDSPVDK